MVLTIEALAVWVVAMALYGLQTERRLRRLEASADSSSVVLEGHLYQHERTYT